MPSVTAKRYVKFGGKGPVEGLKCPFHGQTAVLQRFGQMQGVASESNKGLVCLVGSRHHHSGMENIGDNQGDRRNNNKLTYRIGERRPAQAF